MRVVLVLAMLIMLIHPSSAQALSCAEPPSAADAYEKYDAVVAGSVKQVESDGRFNHVQISLSNSYKGVDQAELTMVENESWGSAWGPSEVGQTYLFYLRQTVNGWENSLCAPTKKLANAQEDLFFLQGKELALQTAPAPDTTAESRTVSDAAASSQEAPNTAWRLALAVGAAGFVVALGAVVVLIIRRHRRRN